MHHELSLVKIVHKLNSKQLGTDAILENSAFYGIKHPGVGGYFYMNDMDARGNVIYISAHKSRKMTIIPQKGQLSVNDAHAYYEIVGMAFQYLNNNNFSSVDLELQTRRALVRLLLHTIARQEDVLEIDLVGYAFSRALPHLSLPSALRDHAREIIEHLRNTQDVSEVITSKIYNESLYASSDTLESEILSILYEAKNKSSTAIKPKPRRNTSYSAETANATKAKAYVDNNTPITLKYTFSAIGDKKHNLAVCESIVHRDGLCLPLRYFMQNTESESVQDYVWMDAADVHDFLSVQSATLNDFRRPETLLLFMALDKDKKGRLSGKELFNALVMHTSRIKVTNVRKLDTDTTLHDRNGKLFYKKDKTKKSHVEHEDRQITSGETYYDASVFAFSNTFVGALWAISYLGWECPCLSFFDYTSKDCDQSIPRHVSQKNFNSFAGVLVVTRDNIEDTVDLLK